MSGAVLGRMMVFFAIIALGYVAGKTKVMSLEGNRFLSKMLNCITIPCSVLYASLCSERSLSNVQILQLMGVAVVMFAFLSLVAQGVPKLLRVDPTQSGQYKFMVIFSNIGYLGIPVLSSVFGEGATISAAIFIMVYYVFLYTYGVFLLRGNKGKFCFKSLLTPTLISSVASIICYLLNIRIQGIAKDFLGTMRNVSTPCAMLVVGCALSTLPVKDLFSNWRLYIVSLLKLLVIPGAVYLCLKGVWGDSIVFQTTIIMMAMPIASSFTILSAQYGKDQRLPATAVFVTTAFSIITIPLLAELFSI